MKKQMLVALWLPLITIAFLGCKKHTTTITAPYQVRTYPGNYQFGGMIDGQEFLPFTNGGAFSSDAIYTSLTSVSNSSEKDFYCSLQKSYYTSGIILTAYDLLEFNIKNFKGTGIYQFNILTSPIMSVPRPDNYGGYKVSGQDGLYNILTTLKYCVTSNIDTGFVECKKWNSENDFEFYFKFNCRNHLATSNDSLVKKIEGTIIRKP